MNWISEIVYLTISIVLTIHVGNLLHKYGLIWVLDLGFDDDLSHRINDMLLILYRLLNVGYVLFTLLWVDVPTDTRGGLEYVSFRLGIIIIGLGLLHIKIMTVLFYFSHKKIKS
jgi:hypothetical protein